MANTPLYLKDSENLLTEQGFSASDTWYHGTSSALAELIKAQGLIRSGDRELMNAAKNTMATIGNDYVESTEPVFLTQSKELAFYWAEQTVRDRSIRIAGDEQPVVFVVKLPTELNQQVKPDVGAASLLLLKEGEKFMAYLAEIYQTKGLNAPDIDLMKADRLEYLTTLGMAYFDANIDALYLELMTD
jgi:hypothetical protein